MNKAQKINFHTNLTILADDTRTQPERAQAAKALHRSRAFFNKGDPELYSLVTTLISTKNKTDLSLKADIITYLYYLGVPKPASDTQRTRVKNIQAMTEYFVRGIPSQNDPRHIAEQGICLEGNIMYSNQYDFHNNDNLTPVLGTIITAASTTSHPDMASTMYGTAANVISKTLQQKMHIFDADECQTLGHAILDSFQSAKPVDPEQERLLHVFTHDFEKTDRKLCPVRARDPELSEKAISLFNAFSQNSPEILQAAPTPKQVTLYQAHYNTVLNLLKLC